MYVSCVILYLYIAEFIIIIKTFDILIQAFVFFITSAKLLSLHFSTIYNDTVNNHVYVVQIYIKQTIF